MAWVQLCVLFFVTVFGLSPSSLFSNGRYLRFQANNTKWIQRVGAMYCNGDRYSPSAKVQIRTEGDKYTFIADNNLYLCQVYQSGYWFIVPALSVPNDYCYFSINQLLNGKITVQGKYPALYWGNGYYSGLPPVMATAYAGGLSEFTVEAFAEVANVTVVYQTDLAQIMNLPMVVAYNNTFDNGGDLPQSSGPWTYHQSTTTTREWNWESTVQFSIELTADVAIPFIGDFGSTTTVSSSVTLGRYKKEEENESWDKSFSFAIPPHQTCRFVATIQHGLLNIPFVATISYRNEAYTDILRGTYTSTDYFNLREEITIL